MKQAIITAKETIEFWEAPVPEISSDEILVKVKAVGLCTFEQRYYTGGKEEYPFHGGHEVCGIVEKVGENVGSNVKPGDKVVVAAITRCGDCYYCQTGKDNMCANGGDAQIDGQLFGPGGLSEYMVCKGYQVYKVNQNMDVAVGTLAEPVACVLRSIDKAHMKPGDNALIIGGGVMGLLHIKVAKLQGLRVFVSEVDENRKRIAKECGADVIIDPTKEDMTQVVKDNTDGLGVEGAFYTAGGPKAIEGAIGALVKGGTLVIYGAVYPKGTMAIDPNKFHYDEIVITGLVSTTKESFLESSRMLSEGIIDVKELISETYPFEDLNHAFQRAVSPETYRVITLL